MTSGGNKKLVLEPMSHSCTSKTLTLARMRFGRPLRITVGISGIGPGRYSGHDAISKLSAVRIVAVTDSATVSKTTLPVPGWAGRLAAAKAITIGHGLAEPITIDSYGFYTS